MLWGERGERWGMGDTGQGAKDSEESQSEVSASKHEAQNFRLTTLKNLGISTRPSLISLLLFDDD